MNTVLHAFFALLDYYEYAYVRYVTSTLLKDLKNLLLLLLCFLLIVWLRSLIRYLLSHVEVTTDEVLE
jgi:hypothetical protein